MDAINRNVNFSTNSFIIQLHENSIFDVELLNEIITEIILLVKHSKDDLTESEILKYFQDLFFIYDKTTGYIIAHFDNNDLFSIENFDEDYLVYINRFRFSLEMLLRKDYENLKLYMDELGLLVNN